MPGLFGVFSEKAGAQCEKTLMSPLDKLGLCDTKSMRSGDTALMGASWLKNAPIREGRCLESQDWMIAVAGDVVSIDGRSAGPSLPWDATVKALANGDYRYFGSWRGLFVICAYNNKSRKAYLVSDKRAQIQIFYARNNEGFFVSTDIPWFHSLPLFETGLNTDWLWDHLFFNFGLFDRAAFLKDVLGAPPASVVEYDLTTGGLNIVKYADTYAPKEHLLSGRKAHENALDVFRERLPMYYSGAETINCALTSGWDTRTVLAFRPNAVNVETYTYGVPGCEDLLESERTSSRLGLKHRKIVFDEPNFLSKLSAYLYYTVYLSGGRQSISRSTLSHAYRTVTDLGTRLPITLSGMAGDLLYRSDRCTPTPVAFDLDPAFATGKTDANREFWQVFMGDRHKEFAEYIDGRLQALKEAYGPFESTAHHLRYFCYEAAPKYWAGEYAISGNFTTLRAPLLDEDLVEMDFGMSEGVLGVSGYASNRGKYKDWVLEAYLIAHTDPKLARLPVRGVPPKMAQYGYLAKVPYKVITRVPQKLSGRLDTNASEDWKGWLANELKPAVHDLIYSKDARVRQYVNPDALSLVPEKQTIHYTMWLMTVEVILRLMENGWALPEETLREIGQ